MKKYAILIAAMLLLPILACSKSGPDTVDKSEVDKVPPKPTEPASEPVPEATPKSAPTLSLHYSDGSNNRFHFWKDAAGETRFTYAPTTPEESSSGTYSGGSATKGTLPEALANDLWQRVTTLEADPNLHAKARSMGTGLFTLTSADKGERSFTITMGPALSDFDAFLKAFR